jgi:O-antigen ligase
MRNLVVLGLLFAGVGYAAFAKGGVWPQDWNITLVFLGVGVLACWLFQSRLPSSGPRAQPWLNWLLIGLICYILFQLVPLPQTVLGALSPRRAEQLQALRQIVAGNFAPLSVLPPATLAYLLRIIAYLSVLLVVRQVTFLSDGDWAVVVPLFAIGAFEATVGMFQIAADWPDGTARGTYVDRDHFAGLLEMILPFTVMYGVAIWRRADTRYKSPAGPAIGSAAMAALAVLLLLGIIYSLSRMGFLVALCSLFAIAVLAVGPRTPVRYRWMGVAIIGLSIVLAFVLLPPNQLIARFADLASSDRVSADTRLHLWGETLSLIQAYPLFGCGLGGYESAFRAFQVTLPAMSIDFAHNDYLQFLSELGTVGFVILALLVSTLVYQALRAAVQQEAIDGRCLAIACVGSLMAMLLHSVADFNMQIPANASVMAWVSGIALGLQRPAYGTA